MQTKQKISKQNKKPLNKTKMKELIIETMCRLSSDIKVSEITPKSSFEDLGFNNIDLTELIMDIENNLNISADIETYYTKTVNELVAQLNN